MNAPPRFRTGDLSYLVAASTSGSARPTTLTISNASARAGGVDFRFIDA